MQSLLGLDPQSLQATQCQQNHVNKHKIICLVRKFQLKFQQNHWSYSYLPQKDPSACELELNQLLSGILLT